MELNGSLPVIFRQSLSPPTLFRGARTEGLSFLPYLLVMLPAIAVFVFTVSVFLCLLYGIIRRAVRMEMSGAGWLAVRGNASVSGADSYLGTLEN